MSCIVPLGDPQAAITAGSPKPSSDLIAYREWLVKADYEASEAYDKAVMTLSGGALAVSITFIHDIAPSPRSETLCFLAAAWSCFGLSISSILISKLTSQWALREAIRQVDEGTINKQPPGARFSVLTKFLNVFAGLAFLLGVGALACFAITNMHHVDVEIGPTLSDMLGSRSETVGF